MTRTRKAVEAALEKKGFVREDGDHHYFYLVDDAGRRTGVFTKTSHSPKHKDLSDPLLGEMAKQVRLTKRDFLRLVDCSLDEGEYRKRIRALGVAC